MIDINAYLGPFAFRRLRHQTPGELLRLMDRKKIEKAAVSSAAAITYRNSQAGNEDVAAMVKAHRDRLIPFGVLNPNYAAWQEDLEECAGSFGMKGLRLYPRWHNYRLTDPACLALVRAATQRGMVITIPMRVEDRRQQSWLVDVPDVAADEMAALFRAVPEGRFVVMNTASIAGSVLGRKNNGLPANYSVEICLLTALIANEVGQLVTNLGEERVLFGTGMPFHDPDPALVKMEVLDVSEAAKRKIGRENAARLLGL